MSKFKKLDDLIDHLRAKGVTAFKGPLEEDGPVVELVLMPTEPPKFEPEKRKKTIEEKLEGAPRGADGLTAEQQEDLYGSAIDAPKAR